jgi:NDP-sugar pyrophosphorylase family protein
MAHCSSNGVVSLVVLAAGLGRRFGGGKQLASIGATGRPLMYFSVMDAWKAGVRKLVLVVNETIEPALEEQFLPLLPPAMDVSMVRQNSGDLPSSCSAPARDKPWGTGHALWCARDAVPGDCIVINADDYYGPGSMGLLVRHFALHRNWAMVSFPLSATLSEYGAVNRGLCDTRDGFLITVCECFGIIREDAALRGTLDGRAVALKENIPVSMNIWGFTADIFDCLKRGLIRFFSAGLEEGAEFYLPSQVMESITAGEGRVSVYPGSDQWYGVTYREDLERLGGVFHTYE